MPDEQRASGDGGPATMLWDLESMRPWTGENGPADEYEYVEFLKEFGPAALTPEGKFKRWWEFENPIFAEAARYAYATGYQPRGGAFRAFQDELQRMRAQGKIGGPDPIGPGGRRLDIHDDQYTRIWAEYDEKVQASEQAALAADLEALGFGAGAQGLYEIGRRALGSRGGGLWGVVPTALSLYGTAWWNRAKAMDREVDARDRRDEALAKAGYPVPPRPNLDEALAELGRRNMNF